MDVAAALRGQVVFLGCNFAAKHRLGGGNFSVPLQWMRGLCRLGLDAIWLEIMPRPAEHPPSATTSPRRPLPVPDPGRRKVCRLHWLTLRS